jgi:hydrogenase assembly chaperone HypC/HupF
MCLTIPGKILLVKGKKAVADFAGIKRNISADIISVRKGDYVLVYSGHAIEKISKIKAEEMLRR